MLKGIITPEPSRICRAQSISPIYSLPILRDVFAGWRMRRRDDSWDTPWVFIAAVIGVIAVVVIALVFFVGGGSSSGQNPAGQGAPPLATQVSSGPPAQSTASPGTGIQPASVKGPASVTVPGTGVFVRVSYIGGFAGTYGINGEIEKVRNSGERIFPLNAATGTVSATFHKEDGSTRHEIIAEIYKDGKALMSAKNSSAYGEVSVSSPV